MPFILLLIIFVLSQIDCFGQSNDAKLRITHLTGDFFIYTTYNVYEDQKTPAHGMYLVAQNGCILFDTPWDTTQFQPLIDSIESRHGKKVVACFATHWHSDRTEGLEYYKNLGIKTYTTTLTDQLSRQNNKKRAEFLIDRDSIFKIGQYSFELYYPGEGHTTDNIIIWFEKEKVLYGGCLIKGAEAKNLGYLGDANILEYEATLKKVKRKSKGAKFIVVSHHDWTNTNSLKRSIELARKLRKRKNY
jgi:metallo-beta-lactamase class B